MYYNKFSLFFRYEEFFRSKTASVQGISNLPRDIDTMCDVLHNGIIVLRILHKCRIRLAAPITITSGYRCPELNRAVGGVLNSAHLRGAAADIVAADMVKLGQVLEEVRQDLKFRGHYIFRILPERVVKGVPSWYHIQLEPIVSDAPSDQFF